jgi:HTH-type transcriptional regulator/antitoxin HigA
LAYDNICRYLTDTYPLSFVQWLIAEDIHEIEVLPTELYFREKTMEESDYQQALKEIEQIFDAEPNTPEYEKLDILTTLVEVYEQQNYPIDPPSPIAAILYYLESRNQGVYTFIENLKHHGVSEEIINIALNEMTQ